MNIPFLSNVIGQWRMRHDPGCQHAIMLRYWKFLLALSSGIVILAVAFGLWSILLPWEPAIMNETSNVSDDTNTLRREQIQSVLDLYGQRKLQYDKLKNAPSSVTDPS